MVRLIDRGAYACCGGGGCLPVEAREALDGWLNGLDGWLNMGRIWKAGGATTGAGTATGPVMGLNRSGPTMSVQSSNS